MLFLVSVLRVILTEWVEAWLWPFEQRSVSAPVALDLGLACPAHGPWHCLEGRIWGVFRAVLAH